MITATNLSVSVGSTRILRNINFQAEPGAFTVVVGPNGSGKTTLLKALCNDLKYSGDVHLNGKNLRDLTPIQAATIRAILPQSTSLSFPFTVREIVALGLTAGRPGLSTEELRHLPELALEKVDLLGFAGRFYQELSGGEQQRVQLARVLCQVWQPILDEEPRILMLDEPVSSLDIKHQLLILQIAREFANQGGTVVAILHDLNLTAMYADQIFVLKNGAVHNSGIPKTVLDDRMIESTFDCKLRVDTVPQQHIPFVLPQSTILQES